MNRAFSALGATVIGLVMIVTFRVTPEPVVMVRDGPSGEPVATPSTGTLGAPGRTLAPAPTPRSAPPPAGALAAAGSAFSGQTVHTIFGDVQVQVVVSGGKVVDVQALALPSDRARSASISRYAAPYLRSEAIRAQSAKIDVVSGATYTSIAYSRSLASALQQAHLP